MQGTGVIPVTTGDIPCRDGLTVEEQIILLDGLALLDELQKGINPYRWMVCKLYFSPRMEWFGLRLPMTYQEIDRKIFGIRRTGEQQTGVAERLINEAVKYTHRLLGYDGSDAWRRMR